MVLTSLCPQPLDGQLLPVSPTYPTSASPGPSTKPASPFMLGNSCSSHLPWGQGQRCVECRSRGGRQVSLTLPSLHQRRQERVDCYGSKEAVSSVMEPDKAEDSLVACPRAHNQLFQGHLEFLTSSPGLFLSSTRPQDGIPESPERPFRAPGADSLPWDSFQALVLSHIRRAAAILKVLPGCQGLLWGLSQSSRSWAGMYPPTPHPSPSTPVRTQPSPAQTGLDPQGVHNSSFLQSHFWRAPPPKPLPLRWGTIKRGRGPSRRPL